MKILIVGLGSMGKRRIRNLLKHGNKNLIGFDTREDRRNQVKRKYGVKTFCDFKEALKNKPEAMIISTPPDSHTKYANIAIDNNIHFFTEVNLSSKEIIHLLKKLGRKSIVAAPSCTMRYHPIVKKLKELIDKKTIGRILNVQHHFGHYLPEWHPWEDYRDFYVSKKETGAAREIVPFELIWLTYLFSEIKSVYGRINKVSKLETNIDDIYEILLEFKNKILATMTVDVISIPSFKETKILGEKGAILCNFNDGIIKINKGKSTKTIKLKMGKIARGYKGNTGAESLYEEEIEAFLDAIMGRKKYPFSLNEELKILKILDAIEISNEKGRKIFINQHGKR